MKSEVAVVKTPSNPTTEQIRQSIRETVNLLGGWKNFIQPNYKVLIKPNVGSVSKPETARVTDPRVVHAVVLELQEFGVEKIYIGESSIVGVDTMEALRVSGIQQVAAETGVELLNLKGEYTRVKVDDPLVLSKVKLTRIIQEVDAIINLPKLRTICATPISVGMKNLKGLLPDEEKKRFHYTDLNKAIVDLNKAVKPALTIVDGIMASEMYDAKAANLLVAGKDVVAVDTVVAQIINVDPNKVEYLKLAAAEGIGEGKLENIKIKGCSIQQAFQPLNQAPDTCSAFSKMFPQVYIIDGKACSGCISTLYLALKSASDKGILDKVKGLRIAVGPRVDIPEGDDVKNIIFLGNCLQKHSDKNFVPGCPFIFVDFLKAVEKTQTPG